ncbi:MAG: DUF4124 domain-containing protein, partial [Wenzhouxiangella sp.]
MLGLSWSLGVSAQIYTYVDEKGLTVYTNVKPEPNRYRVENIGCYGTCR